MVTLILQCWVLSRKDTSIFAYIYYQVLPATISFDLIISLMLLFHKEIF